MKKLALTPVLGGLLVAVAACAAGQAPSEEEARWEARAQGVTIIRDDWGVPHIYAATDADAVFGLMYAQAEDDFPRIERNFLLSQGRLAEAEGEAAIWADLRMKLFIDPDDMRALYQESPLWLRDLMDAWADGLNYYLYTHPGEQPLVLDRFEPWMALTFSEGSIGGDIERVNLRLLEEFYGNPEAQRSAVVIGDEGDARMEGRGDTSPARALLAATPGNESASASAGGWPSAGELASAWTPMASGLVTPDPYEEPRGSNGIAIAPENTVNGNALLLINPHTSFFFRHEAHVVSDEGLNAYGALTWGQFFVYQGFNETAGWMHTSSSVDNIDEFAETIVERDGELFYLYGDEERPVETSQVTVPYRTGDGGMEEREFTVYRTHHGPIVRAVDGRWIAVALMEEPMRALIQSYSRTKAANLAEYLAIMEAHTNSSNNTLFADAEGNIAYLHSNFVPVRNDEYDYSAPVDGSDPSTDWQGLHTVAESPNSINPASGWAYCTNNWPYSASGASSPRQADYPRYMDRGSENPRGIHAIMLLQDRDDFTLEGLREAAYDSYQPAFADWIPALVTDYDRLASGDPRVEALAEPVSLLHDWDFRWGLDSETNSLAVFWASDLMARVREDAREAEMPAYDYMSSSRGTEHRLAALEAAMARLTEDFGGWRTPWGEINRFQRLSGDIDLAFDDAEPSTPVGFSSARWGSLASFGAAPRNGTKRWYGTSGNSFVAVVEFGERLRAVAVTAGGLSNDPSSPHFNDQGERYANGDLRDVRFYREDVEAHAEREYRPGG